MVAVYITSDRSEQNSDSSSNSVDGVARRKGVACGV